MSRTVRPALPVVSTDGRADARGSVTVSLDIARATLAALAGLTPYPWPGVEHGEDRPTLSLRTALEGVPATPEGVMQAVEAWAVEAEKAYQEFEIVTDIPKVRALGGGRYEWRPYYGGERNIIIHFRADDAVISWRSDMSYWEEYCHPWTDGVNVGWQSGHITKVRPHRSRFIGRVIGWASPRSVAVAPMAGNSGPIPRLGAV